MCERVAPCAVAGQVEREKGRDRMKVGFIGLGLMGGSMASNLLLEEERSGVQIAVKPDELGELLREREGRS